jgi:threonine dehydrogenase-like Zn-dependent dehydrogenase
VIATTSQADKELPLRDLGADEVVIYPAVPDWHTAVRDITGGRGVDRVIDTAGTLEQSLRLWGSCPVTGDRSTLACCSVLPQRSGRWPWEVTPSSRT